IMTSNIGAKVISKGTPLGFSQEEEAGMGYEEMKDRITGELKKIFRPEFLNRVDEVIVFHKLTKEDIKKIVELMIDRVGKQLKEREVAITLSEEAKDLLTEKGYDPSLGARPLRRAIQQYVEDLLADEVLSGAVPSGSTILVDRKNDNTFLKLMPKERRPRKDLIHAASDRPEGPKPSDGKDS
ncbi:MAG: AAA family ATPase, partial [Actinobacteria bacterium]|nr:AAA family ATPase [Actinomycetota bacterium]